MNRKRKAGEEFSATGRKRNGNQIRTVTPVSAKSALAARSQSARTRVEASVTEHTHQIPTDSAPHTAPSASELVQSLRRTTVEKVQQVDKASKKSTKNGAAPPVGNLLRAARVQPNTEASETGIPEDDFDDEGEASDSIRLEQEIGVESDSRLLTESEYPRSWKRAREEIVNKVLQKPSGSPIIQVCGSNGAGKTTFVEYLAHGLLSPPEELGLRRYEYVEILDLDPTSNSLTYSGHITLMGVRLRRQQLPSNVAVPRWSRRLESTTKSIPVGLHGQKGDSEHFLMATKKLLDNFKARRSGAPLLVRSPSFDHEIDRGVTAKVASQLMSLLDANYICCLQSLSSSEIGTTGSPSYVPKSACPVWLLESVGGASSKSSLLAEKRRQAITKAYFHENVNAGTSPSDQLPMALRKPYAISFDEDNSNFRSVFLFGDVPPNHPFMLSRVLNGSIVGVFVLEERLESSMVNDTQACEGDNIPFERGHGGSSPDPKILLDGRSVGMALVRSIDIESQLLYLLTPKSTVDKLRGVDPQRIILVHGIADSPDWAFKEDLDAGLQPYYLGMAKQGMQVVKSRRFKKSG